jgi:hypothetical protein
MQQNTGSSNPNQLTQVEIQQCIQDCMTCHDVCLQAAQQGNNDQAKSAHVQLLQDCAELCLTAAHFMQHNSPLYGYVCQAVASVANHCANACQQMGDSNTANACRNAAWSCEQMTKLVP